MKYLSAKVFKNLRAILVPGGNFRLCPIYCEGLGVFMKIYFLPTSRR